MAAPLAFALVARGEKRRLRAARGVATALAVAVALVSGGGQAQQHQQDLYEGRAPGSQNWVQPAVRIETGDSLRVYNTRDPRVEVYLPDPVKATGTALVMLPGGGLRVLSTSADTADTISRLNEEGVAVILLEYRTLQLTPAEIERAEAPRPVDAPPMRFPRFPISNANANPAPDNAALDEVLRLGVMDAQHTLRLVRRNAQEWGIDPDKVGMIGTSAGGGVAFGTMLAGEEGATPDFIVSIFGPALQDVTVPEDAPPLFLVTEADHGSVTNGLLALFQMWKERDQLAELHVYEVPNFSMRISLWGDRLIDWMRERQLLPASAE